MSRSFSLCSTPNNKEEGARCKKRVRTKLFAFLFSLLLAVALHGLLDNLLHELGVRGGGCVLLLGGRDDNDIGVAALINVVGERDVPWEQMSAAGLIVMIPMLIMAYGIRRYFVEGMMMGAVK